MTNDAYTGEVSPGGEAQTRTAGHLEITKVAVDPQMSNNCYLLRCTDTGDQVLIDASDEAPRLLELIGDGGLSAVVTTHQHWDHHRALAEVVRATGATVVAGEPDADAITEQTGVSVDHRVGEGDRIPVGTCSLVVIPVAGHTPGSICLLHDDGSGQPHLFTGDSLFPGGVGNTQGDSGRFQQLLEDVSTRIFDVLPDETWFYPGHGSDSTLGVQRPHLDEWRERGW
ncbi:MAG TPA: MBL fold metallo-hydrolase [Nocardioides sp.]|uniref:MBL fold metallo-hydrolase n=1 Tax=Nocardioides sp. TaxID=35761 RepID=UPI002E3384B9|nr:MBL fold metallo-hydrolase [Nocardioides sp.]HEX3929605.1 MBL fold metallo-hydrolase [Nocardioides sp.]